MSAPDSGETPQRPLVPRWETFDLSVACALQVLQDAERAKLKRLTLEQFVRLYFKAYKDRAAPEEPQQEMEYEYVD